MLFPDCCCRMKTGAKTLFISGVLMRSVGVTAVIDATTPAVMPANRLRSGESVPVSGSAKDNLI